MNEATILQPPRASRRRLWELVPHLTRRQLESEHRLTLLGWLWPLTRQLALLGVIVLVFSAVLDLGIEDYALFVFTGLIAWSAFSGGVSAATTSLITGRHLVFTPGFPSAALPLVAVAAATVDLLVALPVLLFLLVLDGRLELSAMLLPALLVLQFGLTAGVALAVSALNVRFRDVGNVVGVAILLLFYVTPIFYGVRNVPADLRWVLDINPVAAQVEATRAILLDGTLPAWQDLAFLGAFVPLLLAVGWWVFARLEPTFVDEL
jgi:ABC-type polysaccharide/polyol phosphate export permease